MEVVEINKKIQDKTKQIEANIVGCFYDNPELFYEYNDLKNSSFFNPVWKSYFAIGRKLSVKGIKVFNESDLLIFLSKPENEKLHKLYEEYGGYGTIETLSGLFEKDNVDSYVKELQKWVAFKSISEDFYVKDETFRNMTDLDINQMYDYFNAKFNNIFINVSEDIIVSSLDSDLDEIIQEAHEGIAKGMPIPSPMLNNIINGICRGQITLIGGQSGSGKTTILINTVLSGTWENEEPFVLFLNEQDHKKIKKEMLTWIINNKILKDNDKPFNKVRWRDGKFTDEELIIINKAKDLMKEKLKNNKIIIVEFKSYMHSTVVRTIKKYAAMGVKMFAIDTFKMSSDADPNQPFWLAMQNQMKELDDLIKPAGLNVSLICTLQLGKDAILTRYLSANNFGMAKNVIDVASVALLVRKLHNDEYKDGKSELKIMKPIEGTKSGVEIVLDPNKRHSVIFIEKNRNGAAGEEQIVVAHDLGTLRYEEMGITNVPFGI